MNQLVQVCSTVALTAVFGLCACGEEGDADANPAGLVQAAVCSSSSDCGDGYICLAHGTSAACAPTCSGAADECSANASCGGVGVLEVDVCQEPASNNQQDPPDPEERARIPCKSDAECGAIQPGAICAQWRNQRDCTIACGSEAQCDMPALGGVTMDFMTCIADEGQPARDACLPDAACFDDVFACIELGGF